MSTLRNEGLCVQSCCSLQQRDLASGRAEISFYDVSSSAPETMGENGSYDFDIILIGPKEDIVARLEEGAMEGILRESKEAPSLSESLLPLARSLAPGKDVNHASSIDTVVLPHAEGGELRKFSLCATPTRVSRHNSPANPHAITEYIRGMASSRKKKLRIVLCLGAVEHAYAACCAAARAFPVFSMKKAFGNSFLSSSRSSRLIVCKWT